MQMERERRVTQRLLGTKGKPMEAVDDGTDGAGRSVSWRSLGGGGGRKRRRRRAWKDNETNRRWQRRALSAAAVSFSPVYRLRINPAGDHLLPLTIDLLEGRQGKERTKTHTHTNRVDLFPFKFRFNCTFVWFFLYLMPSSSSSSMWYLHYYFGSITLVAWY
jgi:hypothetical protein